LAIVLPIDQENEINDFSIVCHDDEWSGDRKLFAGHEADRCFE
jgi:hypothetical protein